MDRLYEGDIGKRELNCTGHLNLRSTQNEDSGNTGVHMVHIETESQILIFFNI